MQFLQSLQCGIQKSLSIIKVLEKYIASKWSCYLCVNYNTESPASGAPAQAIYQQKQSLLKQQPKFSSCTLGEKNAIPCKAESRLLSCFYEDFTDT